MRKELILGPPGTGKTTELLRIVDEEIASGVPIERLAFLGFTKRAIQEARERTNLDDPPWFKTIHAVAYGLTGRKREEVFNDEQAAKFCDENDLGFSKRSANYIDTLTIHNDGDLIIHIDDMARSTRKSPAEIYKETDPLIDFSSVEYFLKKLKNFKDRNGLYSFSEILDDFLKYEDAPDLDVLVVDEAQDLTPLQWEVVEHIIAVGQPERVYIAGDDDQTIYSWAGADVDYMLNMQADETRVLNQSYRVPIRVQELAQKVIAPADRIDKHWKPRDEEGEIFHHTMLDHVPLQEGQWLVLARNQCYAQEVCDYLRDEGLLFEYKDLWSVREHKVRAAAAWERYLETGEDEMFNLAGRAMSDKYRDWLGSFEADFPWERALDKINTRDYPLIRRVLKQPDPMTVEPRIRVSTIHSAKGAEADRVLLLTDVTRRIYEAIESGGRHLDDERRTLYVGITRARKELHLLNQYSIYTYEDLL